MELLFLGLFLSVCVYMHACESIFFGNLKLGLCLTSSSNIIHKKCEFIFFGNLKLGVPKKKNVSPFFWEFEARIMFDELDVDHGGIVFPGLFKFMCVFISMCECVSMCLCV